MYVTLPQKELVPALAAIQTIAGSSAIQQPILRTVLLEAHATGLSLSAANEASRLQWRVPATVQAPGIVLLPAHLLAGFLHDLPAAPLTLLAPSPTDPQAVQVRCQQVRANLKQSPLPLDEF